MKLYSLKCILLIIGLFFISLQSVGQNAKKQKTGQALPTGEVFHCDFEVVETGIPNYFRVRAGRNTDVAVRLIDKKTDKCVRYAFINSGESYDMKGISEGKYYVKLGLGKEWIFDDTTKCSGQFKQAAIYRKLSKTLDFNIKGSKNHQKARSHELDLDVTKGKEEPAELIDAKEFQR